MIAILRAHIVCVLLLNVCPTYAGRACEERAPQVNSVIKAMDLAYKTQQALEASGQQIAFIARVGQDLSKYGLRYSHMAFVWRDHPKGRWLVVHELNSCGTATSDLYDEGLGNFFLDDLFAFETKIVFPSRNTQARLALFLTTHTPSLMHSPRYNMVAYPFSTQYQNSNQWVLETYAAAFVSDLGTNPRQAAQTWLKEQNYQAITLNIPTMTRLGGRMFRANVAFDDHPFDRRMAGKIDTATVDSVLRFIKQREPDAQEMVLSVN